MIKAIIFDCFGVLVQDGWLPFKERHFSHDPDLLQQVTDVNKAVDRGLITFTEFIEQIAVLANMTPGQTRREIEQNPQNSALFGYITAELKPHYKLGILSNAGADWLDELIGSDNRALFDATVLSCDIGAVKPDAAAYQTIADRLQVSPQSCLFIDDQSSYCEAARSTGMKAITFETTEQCIADLNDQLADNRS